MAVTVNDMFSSPTELQQAYPLIWRPDEGTRGLWVNHESTCCLEGAGPVGEQPAVRCRHEFCKTWLKADISRRFHFDFIKTSQRLPVTAFLHVRLRLEGDKGADSWALGLLMVSGGRRAVF